VLQNARLRAVLVPDGGGRLVVLQRIDGTGNPIDMVNATGALRDDVLLQPPPSRTDRIARYTHTYPAGTFNRPYHVVILATGGEVARVRLSYDAPDVIPHGARFEKTIALAAGAARLVVDERVTIAAGPDADANAPSAALRWRLLAGDPAATRAARRCDEARLRRGGSPGRPRSWQAASRPGRAPRLAVMWNPGRRRNRQRGRRIVRTEP